MRLKHIIEDKDRVIDNIRRDQSSETCLIQIHEMFAKLQQSTSEIVELTRRIQQADFEIERDSTQIRKSEHIRL